MYKRQIKSLFFVDSFSSFNPLEDSASKSASRSADKLIVFELAIGPTEAFAAPNKSSRLPENEGAIYTTLSYVCFASPLLPSMNWEIAIFSINPGRLACCSSALL